MTAAEQWIQEGLIACLPLQVPLMYRVILKAQFTGKQKAAATVELFDGLKATVEVSKWAPYGDAWCIRWTEMPGGDINWNGAAWERVERTRFMQPTLC